MTETVCINDPARQLPAEFLGRMHQMLGEEYPAFLAAYQRPRALALRVNTLKTSVSAFMRCAPAAWNLRPVPWCDTGFYYGSCHGGNTGSDQGRTAGPNHNGTAGPNHNGTAGPCYDSIRSPGKYADHEAGMYYIQEPSAMAVAALSGTRPGEKVLDLCAAPGGKSTQLAAMLQGRGLLVSNEIDPERARILSQNIERMGVRNAIVLNNTPEQVAARFPMFFDRVIVDAPCSGEGMFKKEAQAVSMWSRENIAACARRQADILEEAAKMVRSGGFLMYSTCTFAPLEDEGAIDAFLCRHPEFHVVDLPELLGERMREWGFERGRAEWAAAERWRGTSGETNQTGTPVVFNNINGSGDRQEKAQSQEFHEPDQEMIQPECGDMADQQLSGTIRLFPHKLYGEGHYIALLQRAGEGAAARDRRTEPDEPRESICCVHEEANGRRGHRRTKGQKAQETDPGSDEYRCFASSFLTVNLEEERWMNSRSRLRRIHDTLYLVPYDLSLAGLHAIRPGLELGVIRKNRFEPSHALAMALHPDEVRNIYPMEGGSDKAAAWLRGESLPGEGAEHSKGWTLITIDGCSAGWAKASNGLLKNHYPKGLRRNW